MATSIKKLLSNQWLIFTLFILLSPLVWNLLSQPQQILTTWNTVPSKVHQRGLTIVTGDFPQKYVELRWGGQQLRREGVYYKLIYNPGLNYLNEAFNYFYYLSPRLYFHAGDGTQFSPAHVDPIPVVLIPGFIIGLVISLKQRRWVPIGLLFGLSFIAYWVGIRNFALLFPTALVIYYLAAYGVSQLPFKYSAAYTVIILCYSLYALSSWLIVG